MTSSFSVDPGTVRVLIIEDNDLNADLVDLYLRSMGITAIRRARNGLQGLEMGAEMQPDLVVLDLMMPGLDGFEVCRDLRRHSDFADLPILVQTALDSPSDRNRVFDIGANDLLVKPINRQEFVARVRLHLENRALVRSLRETRRRLDRDLEVAAEMQRALLPAPSLLARLAEETGVTVEALFRMSSELGGDLWGVRPLDGGRFAVYTADFTGHGVTAALNVFRLHTLMAELPRCDDPSWVLSTINKALVSLLPRGQFATMFYGIVEPSLGQIRYAAAAAPSPVAAGALHSGRGVPLGIVPEAEYEARVLPLVSGQPVLLYSDALVESPTQDHPHGIGELKVLERVREQPSASLEPLLRPLLAQMSPVLPDDLTVVRLCHHPAPC